jgi:transposase
VTPKSETGYVETLCRERKLGVGKRVVRKHTEEFRAMAVDRMRSSGNISILAKELGVRRALLYVWRDRLAAGPVKEASAGEPLPRQRLLERENADLKRLLAEKTLELDFFRGALQHVEAGRRTGSGSGAKTSTPTSKA